MKNKYSNFRVALRQLKLIKESKEYIMYVIYIVGGLFGGIAPVLATFYSKLIIDIIQKNSDAEELTKSIIILTIACIVSYTISIFLDFIHHPHGTKLRTNEFGRCTEMYHDIEFAKAESPEFEDKMMTAWTALEGDDVGFQGFYERLKTLSTQVVSAALFMIILCILVPWISLIIIFATVLFSLIGVINANYSAKKEMEKQREARTKNYFNSKLADFNYGKDIRVFSLKGYLMDRYKTRSANYVKVIAGIFNHEIKTSLLSLAVLLVQDGLSIFFIIKYYYSGNISLAEATLCLTIFVTFSTIMRSIVDAFNIMLKGLKETAVYFKTLDEEYVISNKDGLGALDKNEKIEIEFCNVWFKYPNSEEYVLKDLSFKINACERLAIVGTNGAGKTTIVKLICGFYTPQKGKILVNGIDVNEFKKREYFKMFAPVFQDFEVYACSLVENVCGLERSEEEVERAKMCLDTVGLKDKINELPKKYDSIASKVVDEDGIDLSGGQKQKVAIARALYKDANVIILDEPTAALDALAEADIYKSFNDLIKDKTAIYISHRLSSTIFCDHIALFDKNGLCEYGTHEELLALKKKYYSMFVLQGKYYQEGGEDNE